MASPDQDGGLCDHQRSDIDSIDKRIDGFLMAFNPVRVKREHTAIVLLSDEERSQLEKLARKRQSSMSQVIRDLLRGAEAA